MQNAQSKCIARAHREFQNREIKLPIKRLRGARNLTARRRANARNRIRNQNLMLRRVAHNNPQAAEICRRERPRDSQRRIF
jgi:hypothetical protein